MDYDIGDILDARSDPLGHFLIVVGAIQRTKSQGARVLFYRVSSRTYKVFRSILKFFNYCIEKNYQPFFHHFSKEKKKETIFKIGQLNTAFFLDLDDYKGQFTEDSYILLNKDPEEVDLDALKERIKNGLITRCSRLSSPDIHKLMTAVRYNNKISKQNLEKICQSYNVFKKSPLGKL